MASCKFRHTELALNGLTSYWYWMRAPNMRDIDKNWCMLVVKNPVFCKAVSWVSYTASAHTHSPTKTTHDKKLNYEEAISSLPTPPPPPGTHYHKDYQTGFYRHLLCASEHSAETGKHCFSNHLCQGSPFQKSILRYCQATEIDLSQKP